MTKLSRASPWVAVGVVLLLALAIVPAVSGAISPATGSDVAAAPTANACSSPTGHSGGPPTEPADTQWSYGGQGWSNWSFSSHHVSISYNSSFGWTVVFTVLSNSVTGVTMFEEQRTLGMTVWANVTTPNVTANYLYHSYENDAAFANVTNTSTVYVSGSPVAALGLLNASVAACSTIHQAIRVANQTVTRTGFLNVTGMAEASVSFSPSLGLIPLNLSGVYEWNSSSTATAAASWNVSYAYQQLNGASGSGSKVGSLSGTAPVNLTGVRFPVRHSFKDHKSRIGVVLIVQGPFNCYDGFILIPRGFDFFGTTPHGYDPYAFGSAGISSEDLYVSPGPGGIAVSAADQSFAAVNTGVNGFAGPAGTTLVAPAAPSSPGTTVEGQPISLREAAAIDQALAQSPSLSNGPTQGHEAALLGSHGEMILLVAGAVVAAVVGTVVALAWAPSSRRRSSEAKDSKPLVPDGAANLPDAGTSRTQGGGSGPSEDPRQR